MLMAHVHWCGFCNLIICIIFLTYLQPCATITSSQLVYRSSETPRTQPNQLLTTTDLIEEQGYTAETHRVVTEDGYHLYLHRIPNGKNGGTSKKRPIAFVQHGILAASSCWVLTGPRSLAFLLADAGYDVWLGNFRGNSYSHGHENATIRDADYWDFSFHEQGIYDMASMIDYALETAGQKDLYLIAHSKGAACAYILLSMKPEYNRKIRLLATYGPAVYFQNSRNPIFQFLFRHFTAKFANTVMHVFHFYEMPDMRTLNPALRKYICGQQGVKLQTCVELTHLLGGYDYLFNETSAEVVFRHFPSGGGLKEVIHYALLHENGKFTQFDLVKFKEELPEYPFANVKVPVIFFRGDADLMADKRDIQRLIDRTPNVAGVYDVAFQRFTHGDYIWGITTDELVYLPTIEIMKKF